MSRKTKSIYMHTINGHPAEYIPHGQIIYASNKQVNRLCASLEEIKIEQRLSEIWREKNFCVPNGDSLSYIRIPLKVIREAR